MNNIHPCKILVTGATGFVGEVLCNKLLEYGLRVTGVTRSVKKLHSTNYSLVVKNIDSATDWSELLVNIDLIIHLAAHVHVTKELGRNSANSFDDTNSLATINFAKQAAISGVRRFIFLSSIGVNGYKTQNNHFFNELSPISPHNNYSISKWEAEQHLEKLSKDVDMEIVILRPPLVYGCGVKANFLSLLDIIYKSWPLPFGNFHNKRSMIYLENLVSAIVLCLTHPKAAGQTYLVCDDETVSTPDLARKLASSMRSKSLVFPFPIGLLTFAAKLVGKKTVIDRLSQSLEIDCSKIKHDLDWQPPFSLQQGLQKTVDWYLQTKQDGKH